MKDLPASSVNPRGPQVIPLTSVSQQARNDKDPLLAGIVALVTVYRKHASYSHIAAGPPRFKAAYTEQIWYACSRLLMGGVRTGTNSCEKNPV